MALIGHSQGNRLFREGFAAPTLGVSAMKQTPSIQALVDPTHVSLLMIRVGSLAALIYRIWGLQPITASNTRNPTYVATTIDQPCIAMGSLRSKRNLIWLICVDLTSARASGRPPDGETENDPFKPKDRGPGPLYSCCHARHGFKGKYRKQDAPWLAPEEYGKDPEAAITFSEFRALAWQVANEAARQLGWIRTCDELHEAAKKATSAI